MHTDSPQLDTNALQELQSIMEDEFPVLIELYINDAAEKVSLLSLAIQNQDIDLATKTAHAFKGASSNVGAIRLSHLCKDTEYAGREGDMLKIERIFSQLQAAHADVVSQLTPFLP